MTITKSDFGPALGGRATLYTLSSEGHTASICDLGCTLVRFTAPGGRNIVLGYGCAEDYLAGSSSIGATVGRFAGRIGGAAFTLDGKQYRLSRNDGDNHLHGGFGKRLFKAEEKPEGLVFTLVSRDGDEGFPGRLKLTVTVTLDGGRLTFTYRAVTSKPTYINITNHSYFNLGGDLKEHTLTVKSGRYLELGYDRIPTGQVRNARSSCFRLTGGRLLSHVLEDPELAWTRGLDHSFVLPGIRNRINPIMCNMAFLFGPGSGLTLCCRSTQPMLHVYTAGFLDRDAAADRILMPWEETPGDRGEGNALLRNAAICLEPQHAPNSPNLPMLPTTRLDPGRTYCETVEYEIMNTEE